LELFQPHFRPSLFDVMASDDLDIPQIAVFGVPEDNNHATPSQTPPSPPSDGPHLPPSPLGHATSPTDNQGFLSLPIPILKSARNYLDALCSPSLITSETSSLQRRLLLRSPPTLQARFDLQLQRFYARIIPKNTTDCHP